MSVVLATALVSSHPNFSKNLYLNVKAAQQEDENSKLQEEKQNDNNISTDLTIENNEGNESELSKEYKNEQEMIEEDTLKLLRKETINTETENEVLNEKASKETTKILHSGKDGDLD